MAKTYKSVTQQVWERIDATPHAIHSILPIKGGSNSARALHSRVAGSSSPIKTEVRRGCASVTQEEAGHVIAEASLFLQSKGLTRGDRVAILGWDSLYWLALSRAAEGMGLVVVPPHPNSTKEQNVHVLNDSQPLLLISESQKMIDNLIDLTQFKRVRLDNEEVAADQSGLDDNLQTVCFDEIFQHVPDFLANAETSGEAKPSQFRPEATAEFNRLKTLFTTAGAKLPFEITDLNTIIYTSGSTGLPKGVKHTHKTEAAICQMLAARMPFGPQHIILHLLPWSHIFGKCNGKALGEVMGCINAYTDPMTFKDVLTLIRPHLLLAVPLLWNRLKNEIEKLVSGADDLGPMLKAMGFKTFSKSNSASLKLAMAKWALWVRTWSETPYTVPASAGEGVFKRTFKRIGARIGHCFKKPSLWAARKYVCPGIRAKAGLQDIVMSVSGSAAIPGETSKFFEFIGVALREGYGSSETGGGWCVNFLEDFEMGSLGKPLDGAEIRIIPVPGMPEGTGEVEVRGDFVFPGYWRNPAKTAEVFTAGENPWFKMGDTVRCAANGRLWFESRGPIKKLLTGEFYSEERVQTALEAYPLFSAAVPTGEGFSCIGTLIFLDPSAAKRIAGAAPSGTDQWEFWAVAPAIQESCKTGLQQANKTLLDAPESLKWEQVRRFIVCPGELTIENGLRTNTNKPKNKEVRKLFVAQVNKMHA